MSEWIGSSGETCLTAALTVMAVALCTVVTMAATVGRGIRGN